MDGFVGYCSGWGESDREGQVWYGVTYVWNLKNKLVNITKQKQTHGYRKQTGGCQWGEGRGEGQEKDRGLRGTNYDI